MWAVTVLFAGLFTLGYGRQGQTSQQLQNTPCASTHMTSIESGSFPRRESFSAGKRLIEKIGERNALISAKVLVMFLMAFNPAVAFNLYGSGAAVASPYQKEGLVDSGTLLQRKSCHVAFSGSRADSSSDIMPLSETVTPTISTRCSIEPRTVYVVSTPIGNLEDITLRGIRTLREVDVIAAEDTRVTGMLLQHLGIERTGQLVSHHDHNLRSSVPKLIELLEGGASVALVSDAGTPGISDPGRALAAECISRNIPVVPVPGPCAAIAALSVTGMGLTEFVFMGFLPRSNKLRRLKVAEVVQERRAVVLYEAPHRVINTLEDLSAAGASHRGVMCARELTKLHEELHRGTIASALSWYASMAEREQRVRGEFTIVIAPLDQATLDARQEKAAAEAEVAAAEEVRARLAAGGSVSRVAKEVASKYGLRKSVVYAEALRQQEEEEEE